MKMKLKVGDEVIIDYGDQKDDTHSERSIFLNESMRHLEGRRATIVRSKFDSYKLNLTGRTWEFAEEWVKLAKPIVKQLEL